MFELKNLASEDINVNGLKIHFYRTGSDKPALVLLHGITDSAKCWPRLVQHLGDEFDMVMVDARGHGLSEAPERGYSFDEQAADVVALLTALELHQPVLLGHSMGAMTAIALAASSPGSVRALILEDPPLSAKGQISLDESELWRKEAHNKIKKMQSQALSEIISDRRGQAPNWSEGEFMPWAEAKHQVSPNVVEIAFSLQLPWRSIFKQIACPTLLLTADPDDGGRVTPEIADEASALLSNGQVVYIQDAGHNIRRDQFDKYLAVVRDFLEEIYLK